MRSAVGYILVSTARQGAAPLHRPGPLCIEGGVPGVRLGKSSLTERGIRGAPPRPFQPARKALQTVASPTLYSRANAPIVSPAA
jgi:hypothetical protein